MTTPHPWQQLRSHPVFTTPWITVRQDTVALPNGTVVDDYFVAELPDVALVMPVTPDSRVIFVRQYRHAVAKILLELPAGTFDPATEDAATAALRELREETSYHAETVESLGILYDNPVKCTNATHVFLARDVLPLGGQQWDITEDIEVVPLAWEDIPAAIATGQIAVSGTLATLYLGSHHLQRPFSIRPQGPGGGPSPRVD